MCEGCKIQEELGATDWSIVDTMLMYEVLKNKIT